jgi:WD40 repeat protein
MASDSPKVLISYSHDSLEHARRVLGLAERLRKDGVDAQLDQYVAGTPPGGWPRWMLDQLDSAEFVLAVCTETYRRRFLGRDEPDNGKGADWEGGIITLELYHARSDTNKFVPVLFDRQDQPFIPRPLSGHTHYLLSSENNYAKLYDFLTGQAGVVPGKLGPLRNRAREAVETLSFENAVCKLNGVPDLPPHYLPRENELIELKKKLLADVRNVAITGRGQAVGVQGMGGIGKTVLAAALAHDSEVRRAFADGIYWLTVGQNPNVLALQGQFFRHLTGSEQAFTTEQEGKDALRDALEGRQSLLVLDDVWSVDHADPFSVKSSPTRLLLTTRNSEVLVGLDAEEHRVDVLSPSDACRMLVNWSGEKNSDQLPPEAAEVARECGYLPLALAMIGAMVRLRPTAWKDALTRLRRSDLGAIKRAFPGYRYPDLLRAIEISIDALDPADGERYLDLAVFPEDQPIPEGPLAILWKLEELDTRACMTRLIARSLASKSELRGSEALMLHDLQRDLIHKRREKQLPSLHSQLVDSWGELNKLADPYAWRWVTRHLKEARRTVELRELLFNFDWLQGKLKFTDVNALLSDYDYVSGEQDLLLVQAAIRLSAHVLARDHTQLGSQITGRLLSNAEPSVQAFLRQVSENTVFPWLRPLRLNLTPPGGSLIRILTGHSGGVNAVAIVPDGCLVVSASNDKTLRVWELETGQLVHILQGHSDKVIAVAITPDGRRAVSAARDKTLRTWELKTGQLVGTLQSRSDWLPAVAIAPDGHRAVSTSRDNTLKVWELETGQPVRTLQGHSGRVTAVAITPDGRQAVSASRDNTLRVWDLETGQSMHILQGHRDWVNAVAISPDGCRAVSASDDKTLRVWKLETGQPVHILQGHRRGVNAVAITSDGIRVVSASDDKMLRIWALETGQSVHDLQGHSDRVTAVAVTPDAGRVVSASDDKTLRVWKLETSQSIPTLQVHDDRVTAVAVTPDGRRAVSASRDNTLKVWELETGQPVCTLQGHGDWVSAVAITPDGRRAVSASRDKMLRIWELETGQPVRTFQGHGDRVTAVAVTPDGVRAISGSDDKTLRVWELETGRSVCTLQGHSGGVTAVAITPDGRRAVSASRDNTLRIWELETGRSVSTLQGHGDRVSAVVITPDGRRVVSASDDKTVRIWESGRSVRPLRGHSGGVTAVAVTPDGRCTISASYDNTLRVWELETGQSMCILQGHGGGVTAVAITPDGGRAISASDDKSLRVWELETGQELVLLTGDAAMFCCAVSLDGRTIVSGDDGGTVHFLRTENFPAVGRITRSNVEPPTDWLRPSRFSAGR